MEVLRGDIRLCDRDIEFHLDRQHEIHHFQGTDAKIAELSVQRKRVRHHAARSQNGPDKPHQPAVYRFFRLRMHSMLLPKTRGNNTV